jgi:hypothetical protein
MALLYALDEDLRGQLWRYMLRHNARGLDPIDVVRVGDVEELPLGTKDPEILLWCEAQRRILISHDRSTSPTHLSDHLAAGHRSPGVFLVRDVPMIKVVDFLVIAAYASEPAEWFDQYFYIP